MNSKQQVADTLGKVMKKAAVYGKIVNDAAQKMLDEDTELTSGEKVLVSYAQAVFDLQIKKQGIKELKDPALSLLVNIIEKACEATFRDAVSDRTQGGMQ